jgi:toxin FitB
VIILDTNVLSEALKPSPSDIVDAWVARQDQRELYITTVTQAEILYGIERLPFGRRRTRLEQTAEHFFLDEFADRILPLDEAAAREYPVIAAGRAAIGRPIAQFDALIAAITRASGATLATRNTRDFTGCGVRLINPWEPADLLK